MNDNNSEKPYLRLREIFNELLLRDIILFTVLFLFTIAQDWENIFLFLFPIITFAYSLFFRIISTNKLKILPENNPIIYNPLGLEKKHANRLFFSTLFQLILLFWIGGESLYHPQLIDDYNIYFNVLFFFIYSFGFYWIIIDIWKYSKIEIFIKKTDPQYQILNKSDLEGDLNSIISFLKIKKFRQISIINFIAFIVLNVLNILYGVVIHSKVVQGFSFQLPGTGIESSNPIQITPISFLIIGISPLLISIFLIIIYKDINNFTLENLNKVLKEIPDNLKAEILNNLKNLRKKFDETLSME